MTREAAMLINSDKGRKMIAHCTTIICAALVLMVVDSLFGPFAENGWWPSIWIFFSLAIFVALLVLRQEKSLLSSLSFRARLPLRIFTSLCIVALILSVFKWPLTKDITSLISARVKNGVTSAQAPRPAVLVPPEKNSPVSGKSSEDGNKSKASADQPDDKEKVQAEIAFWGTLFSWLLAIVALVIAFVTSWVYAIARETKENALIMQGVLNQKAEIVYSNMVIVQIFTNINTLLDELDMATYHVERMRLRSIRNLLLLGESLLMPMPDVRQIGAELSSKRRSLSVQISRSLPLDFRYIQFLRHDIVLYLENLHPRLIHIHLSHSAHGQECINEIEALCRLFKGENP